MINFKPTLQCEILYLRPLQIDDFEGLYAVASDPKIWEQHPQPQRYQRDIFQSFFNDGLRSKGALVVIDSKTEKIIGSSRFYDYDPVNSQITIGFSFLGRNYWGGKYNREMKRLIINHALSILKTVLFAIGPNNIRSQKAILKIGASYYMNREKMSSEGATVIESVL
jgi:RimJ/RimL family protein N-acetyltransferase